MLSARPRSLDGLNHIGHDAGLFILDHVLAQKPQQTIRKTGRDRRRGRQVAAKLENPFEQRRARMTGIHRDTVMRLGVRVGQTCEKILNEKMVQLPCERIEDDETCAQHR